MDEGGWPTEWNFELLLLSIPGFPSKLQVPIGQFSRTCEAFSADGQRFPIGREGLIVTLFPPLLEQRIRSISNSRLPSPAGTGVPTDSVVDPVVAVSAC
jgi:hypothetical protein